MSLASTPEFRFPILTVDPVVFRLVEGKLAVLLIQRGFEPFLHDWALPGAYISSDETSRIAFDRVLAHKTGVLAKHVHLVEQPYAFDLPERDPRGYAVTIMYIGLCNDSTPDGFANTKSAQNPMFVPINDVPSLAYDHNNIVTFAHNRLKTLAATTGIVCTLLPKQFTLSQLQTAYEAIFCKPFDKRNFRKKILALGCIAPVGTSQKDGAHRPASLYTAANTAAQSSTPDFS